MSEPPEKIPLIILDSSESPSLFVTHHTKYMVELPSFPSFEWDFLVIDTSKGEDLILSFYFLNHFNPSSYWRQGMITFNYDHKAYYDPLKSFSYGFYSAKSCASLVEAEKHPSHCACDHHIELEGSLPLIGVIYALSNQESDTLRAYISENIEKHFIRPSPSSTGEPVLFVKKKYGGPRLCVYYHKLNAVTRKDKYPVPPITQLLTALNGSSIFSKIDLCGAYNLLRIKEGDEHFTALRTKYGSYEYLVMPFGLTNVPASFQNLVNDIFYDLLDIYAVVYLDDIMVFFKSEEEHVTHVSAVLSRLRASSRFAKASKFIFHVSSVEYLAYIVSSEGLRMDQAKVRKILNCPPPRNLKALQSFLGFANFYSHFIKNYSKNISSLASFLKKDSCFPLNEEALSQFHQLKEAFTTA
ncbi:hypothetical protein O181_001724 [Austropuccinia psidii MF-1]|uniref:Reverse transcriptase domain-containing protein n=1 Tax=Austropuccinia psidii MF-1 TaxID=1389203 RepID=A0A9Q3GC55_9BASI|nr:hypothetical protein [Austropuccinia psidii MF-1]